MNADGSQSYISPVFRDMLGVGRPYSVPSSPRLRFCDHILETAEVIRHFLDLIYGRPLEIARFDRWEHLRLFVNVAGLLRKYECAAAIQALKYILSVNPPHFSAPLVWGITGPAQMPSVQIA